METSLKNGFAQIFSCRPKDLSCPKFGGAGAPLAPSPARTPMTHTVNIHSLKHHCKHCFVNSENKTKKKEISVTSLRNKRSSQVNSENKSKRKRNVLFL